MDASRVKFDLGIAIGGGSPSNLVNGSQDNSFWWTNATGDGTGFIAFDFGSPRIVDAFRWLQQTNNAHGIWRLEGSNNNADWLQIGQDFTLQGSVANQAGFFWLPNESAYRYYRLRHMSGSRSQTPYLWEIEFRIV